MSALIIKCQKTNLTIIGSCKMDDVEDFNAKIFLLKQKYGQNNVWFDRCYISRTITFLTK